VDPAALGELGVWTMATGVASAERSRWYARELERIGVPTLWIPEGVTGKEIFSHAGILLAATDRLVVATGIASIWARDAHAMEKGARGLGEAYPGRLVLGLGVSHAPLVARRGGSYDSPLEAMRAHLQAMGAADYAAPDPPVPVPRLIGALGPKMLELAAELTDGAHPYLVPVAHTREARTILGPGRVLAVEQAVVLDTEPGRARATGRDFVSRYLGLDNYRRNLLRLGFAEGDLDGGGSDALVDALVAWGEEEAVLARVREHLAAGADHVCIQLIGVDLEEEVSAIEGLWAAWAVT
jgi:probable F420-dependent oxidoreductase